MTSEFLFSGYFSVKLVNNVVNISNIIAAIPSFRLHVSKAASIIVHSVAYSCANVIMNPLETAGPIG